MTPEEKRIRRAQRIYKLIPVGDVLAEEKKYENKKDVMFAKHILNNEVWYYFDTKSNKFTDLLLIWFLLRRDKNEAYIYKSNHYHKYMVRIYAGHEMFYSVPEIVTEIKLAPVTSKVDECLGNIKSELCEINSEKDKTWIKKVCKYFYRYLKLIDNIKEINPDHLYVRQLQDVNTWVCRSFSKSELKQCPLQQCVNPIFDCRFKKEK